MGNKLQPTNDGYYDGYGSWTELNCPPKGFEQGNICRINANEFIIATIWKWDESNNKNVEVIPECYIYNVLDEKWRLWMKYPLE